MPNAIHMAYEWSQKWKPPLNVSKCVHLPIKAPESAPLSYTFPNQNTFAPPEIQKVDYMRDLAIAVTTTYTPSDTVCQSIQKARRMLFYLKRAFLQFLVPTFWGFIGCGIFGRSDCWPTEINKTLCLAERELRSMACMLSRAVGIWPLMLGIVVRRIIFVIVCFLGECFHRVVV